MTEVAVWRAATEAQEAEGFWFDTKEPEITN
jgi:hypothetical protein